MDGKETNVKPKGQQGGKKNKKTLREEK